MKKTKKTDEKNSLEQLLLKGKEAYDGNKSKAFQYLLLVVLVVVVIVTIHSKFSGASSKLDAADTAYYNATQASFSGVGVADGGVLANVATSYRNSVTGSILSANAGDAFLSAGQADIASKLASSRGVKSTDGETNAPADPTVNLNAAFEAYQVASNSSDSDVRARAYYGSGVVQEVIASVASDEESVEVAIAKAKEAYAKVAEVAPNSPFCVPATKALTDLERRLTVDFYKNIAKKFSTLPEPTDESILSEKSGQLNVGEKISVENFGTNDDSAENEADGSAETSTEGLSGENATPDASGSTAE